MPRSVLRLAGALLVLTVSALLLWPASPAQEDALLAPAAPPREEATMPPALQEAEAAPSARPPFACEGAADDVLLRVGPVPFTRAAVCREVLALAGPQPGPPATSWRQQARLVRERLIEAELVHQALAREGTPVTDAELDAAVAAATGGRTSLPSNPEILRSQLRGRLEIARLLQGKGPPEPTEAELRLAYQLDPSRYGEPAVARISPWVIRVSSSMTPDQDAAAREQAEDFFGDVATGAKAEGAGLRLGLTPLAPFELRVGSGEAALEAEVFRTAGGQWARPVRTRIGWVVGHVVEKSAAQTRPFEQVVERMRAMARGRQSVEEKARLLAQLRAAGAVEDRASW